MPLKRWINDLYYVMFCKYKSKQISLKKRYFNEFIKPRQNDFNNFSNISPDIEIHYPKGLFLGSNVHIDKHCYIDANAGVIIGSNTHISKNLVLLSTKNYCIKNSGDSLTGATITIGSNVQIGMNVTILPGARIGNSAIIESGCTIVNSISDGEIVSLGSPTLFRNHRLLTSSSSESFDKSPIPVFVVSTGRSGTTTMSDWLSNADGITAEHETFYRVLEPLAVQYRHGLLSNSETKQALETLLASKLQSINKKLYVLSDQKLLFFLDLIAELFPNAKYIWLIRDPYDFAVSAVARGWFEDQARISISGQFISIDNSIRTRKLRDMTLFDRDYYKSETGDELNQALDYWKMANLEIEQFLSKIPSNNYKRIHLEQLASTKRELNEFLSMVDLGEPEMLNIIDHKSRNKYYDIKQKISAHNYNRKDIDLIYHSWKK